MLLFEKLKSSTQYKNRPDKLSSAQQEVNEMKSKVEEYNQDFQDISKLIKNELDRFDREKVEDFRDSVEQFLKSMIGHQKQIIKLWETYFEQTEGLEDEDEEDDEDDEENEVVDEEAVEEEVEVEESTASFSQH